MYLVVYTLCFFSWLEYAREMGMYSTGQPTEARFSCLIKKSALHARDRSGWMFCEE